MKNFEINISRSPISVDAGGLELNVFRVGTSPLIKNSDGFINPDRIKSTHTHFTYEVFFVTSGKLKLVTDHSTTEYKSSVLIIPPKIKHFSVPTGGESYCLLFSFKEDTDIEEQLRQGVCELPMTEDIAFYIKKFTEKTAENTFSAESDAKHLTALIFNNVFSNIKSANLKMHNTKKHASQHISAIDAYINENIYVKLTLEDVAKNVYLSPKQVSRIIKKEYNCSFSTLVTDKRLAKAAIMLKNTDMKISEIASQTFCGSENYFYNIFKSKYGLSPLKYRKESRILDNKQQKIIVSKSD